MTAVIRHLKQRLHLIHDCPFSINFLVASAFGVPSGVKVLITTLSLYLPFSIPDFMYDYSPGEDLALARENRRVAVKAAKDLVEPKVRRPGEGNLAGIFDAARYVCLAMSYRGELLTFR